MRVNQSASLTFKNQKEYILIPYIEEERMTKEWLQLLLPFHINEAFPMEMLFEKGNKTIIQCGDQWLQIELLPIKKEKASVIEDFKEAFGTFGKRITGNCKILLDHLSIEGIDKNLLVERIVQALLEGAYSFKKEHLTQVNLENIFEMREQLTDEKDEIMLTLIINDQYNNAIERGYQYGRAINRARTIANLPNNYLHVKELTSYSRKLAEHYQIECTILGNRELEALHSGGILSVNGGSANEANLIVLTYRGEASDQLNAVIGKGVMFDAGGYHLKSLEGMDGMKYDMCGAANVLGVIEIMATLKAKVNVMVIIPAVENVISPDATKMGDVITTMSGKTVEIWNTDAEGRLILCDAITYAIRNGATRLIDLATLTYSCHSALGSDISGIFANCEIFYETFMEQAHKMGEKVWRLPLDPIYHKQLKKSKVADLMNYAPGYGAGASVAACFLESFVENNLPWIHLDVVGAAVCRNEKEDKEKGATGVLTTTIASLLEIND